MIKFLIISRRKTLKINWEIKATAKPLIEILSYQNALIVNHCKSLTCMGPMDKIIVRDTYFFFFELIRDNYFCLRKILI